MRKPEGKLLIVDDDPYIILALNALLKNYFDKIMLLQDPALLLENMKKQRYDMILLDMYFRHKQNPEKEGIYWLRKINKLDASVIVIMIADYVEMENAMEAVYAGATDFIVKPWQNEKTLSTIMAGLKLGRYKKIMKRRNTASGSKQPLQGSFKKLNLAHIEKWAIISCIRKHHGNLSSAAKELGITRGSLYRRLDKYSLQASVEASR